MATQTAEVINLNNGVELPALGLGVFQSPPEETVDAVEAVLVASRLRQADLELRCLTALQQTGSVLEVVRLSFFGDDVATLIDERGL